MVSPELVRPVAAFTATCVTVNSRPAAAPSMTPRREFDRCEEPDRINNVPIPTSALSQVSIAATE
jgi:hypothetical protein